MHTPATIGLDVGDLRLPVKPALQTASQLNVRAIELPAVEGDVSPRALSSSGRRHLRHYLAGLGLELTALGADVPHTRLTDAVTSGDRVERTLEIIELAAALGVPTVTAAAPALTHPDTGAPAEVALAALAQIADRADLCRVQYALRPHADRAPELARLLRQLDCPYLKLCVDPAALVMSGVNPVAVVEQLPDAVTLAHARDGTVGRDGRLGVETRLGEGEVDLVGFWDALREAGYRGPHIVRRTEAAAPAAELAEAVSWLRERLPR